MPAKISNRQALIGTGFFAHCCFYWSQLLSNFGARAPCAPLAIERSGEKKETHNPHPKPKIKIKTGAWGPKPKIKIAAQKYIISSGFENQFGILLLQCPTSVGKCKSDNTAKK